ncbi:MAG: sensor histidine kinase [Frankia sp.]
MTTTWQRSAQAHPRAAISGLALLLFALSFPGSLARVARSPDRIEWWPAVMVAAVACTTLLWYRGHPRLTVALTTACAAIVTALGYVPSMLLLAPVMAALYLLAVHTSRRSTWTYAIATAALVVGTAMIIGPSQEPLELKTIGPAAWLLLPAALGSSDRLQRAYLEAVRARAQHAEHTREEEVRHRVAEERMRIARDLHDVVAHHLALANAQAGTAERLMHTRPDQTRTILADLTGTTSSALRDLKATVGLLRQAGDGDAPRDPAPGLARLPDLSASFESAGLAVTVTTEGKEQPLSPGVDLTAYRIVQEALTNVTKHAATRAAAVRMVYSHDKVTITVTDGGGGSYRAPAHHAAPLATSATTPNRGYGLLGMRERAVSVGGRMLAGHHPEGGFEVRAELPIHSRIRKNVEPDNDPRAAHRGSDASARDLPDTDRLLQRLGSDK